MNWTHIWNNDVKHCLEHLHAFEMVTQVDGVETKILVHFGHHTFTDDKETGQKFQWAERINDHRYFSASRYEASKDLPGIIRSELAKQQSYITAYYNKKNIECYYYINTVDYVMFLEIRKPQDIDNYLKVKVVSAYEKDQWGTFPNGKKYKLSYLLSERVKGNYLLKRKKG